MLLNDPAPPVDRNCAFNYAGKVLRQSAPMRIGKHEWRLVLYRTTRLLTGYEWRRQDGRETRVKRADGDYFLPGSFWRRDEDWPRYDHNNGGTAGLPATLHRLWKQCPWAHMRETMEAVWTNAEPGRPLLDLDNNPVPTRVCDLRHHAMSEYHGFYWVEAMSGEPDRHALHGPFADLLEMADRWALVQEIRGSVRRRYSA